jgi:Ca2+-binding RTX toxin-like protein
MFVDKDGTNVINHSTDRGNDILVGDAGGSSLKEGSTANFALVLDTSGSMTAKVSFGDRSDVTRLQAMRDSVDKMLDDLHGSGAAHVRVHIDQFGGTATSVGTFDVMTTQGLADAHAAVARLTQTTGGTNYEAGLQSALNWMNTTGAVLPNADVNKMLFISDGAPNMALPGDSSTLFDSHGVSTGVSVSAANAIKSILGNYNPSGTSNDDKVSEVDQIINNHHFTIDAVGINVTTSALALLSQVEGPTTLTHTALADNITTAAGLHDIVGTLAGSQVIQDVASSDHITGGAGNDLIYGDSMNTDALAVNKGLTDAGGFAIGASGLPSGSGNLVFEKLELGGHWSHADTLNYIEQNADTLLAKESGRTGGVDLLEGGSGNDRIYGQEGNDTIIGGQGNDVLVGGTGADTFAWKLGVQGTTDTPAVDHITDFAVAQAGEALDLRDLLQDEHNGTASGVPSNLSSFLSFSVDSGHLELLVNHDPANNASATQKIIFDNISGGDVTAARDVLAGQLGMTLASGSHVSDADLLKKLVDTGHLQTHA